MEAEQLGYVFATVGPRKRFLGLDLDREALKVADASGVIGAGISIDLTAYLRRWNIVCFMTLGKELPLATSHST